MASLQQKHNPHGESDLSQNLKNAQEIRFQTWDAEVEPMVSICCLAYNHENFIRDAIEGFLMQQTTFKVEILIHDDASEDHTPSIIKEYEHSHPKLFRTIYQTENQFSKGEKPGIINLARAKGRYIALCEGDDYWTDPRKLQKQVEFLEQNPSYSVCVAGYSRLNELTGEKETIIHGSLTGQDSGGFSFGLEEMQQTWLTKTLTAMVRKKVYDNLEVSMYKYYRDIHFFYHLIKNYKAYYIQEEVGVYRIHEGGINSMKQGHENSLTAHNCYEELYKFNADEFTRKKYLKSTLGLLNSNVYSKNGKSNYRINIRLYFRALKLVRQINEIKWLFTVFVNKSLKENIKKFLKKIKPGYDNLR